MGRQHLCRPKPAHSREEIEPAVRPFKNGKSYAPGTKLYDHQCVWCGAEFRGSADRAYCSTRCRVAGWRANRREIKRNRTGQYGHISETLLISWGQIRFAVLERDGFKCRYCGRGAKQNVVLEVDHITPLSGGGLTEMENLVAACRECNAGKRSATIRNLPE